MLILDESEDDAQIQIETIEDISIDRSNSQDVYQTKHHLNSMTGLTDRSVSLWKTLRIWAEGILSGKLDLDLCQFNLITTAVSSEGTIPYTLRQGTQESRSVEEIVSKLDEIASEVTNETNKSAYKSYNKLSKIQKEKLINKILIIDASLDINNSKEKILRTLKLAVSKAEQLYERLEGWFVSQVILQLQEQRSGITFKEINQKIIEIADALKIDNLPNDFNEPIVSDDEKLKLYADKLFVKQLKIVGLNQRVINHAISDYYRAFNQKSKWLREGLIGASDELEYDKILVDDWDRKFAFIIDSVHVDDENIQMQRGKDFYKEYYVDEHPQIYIKDRFTQRYMVVGSCHILADKQEMGWHPDFKNKLYDEAS